MRGSYLVPLDVDDRQLGSILTPVRHRYQDRLTAETKSNRKLDRQKAYYNHDAFPIKQQDPQDFKFNTNTLVRGRLRNFRVSHVNSINLYKEGESPKQEAQARKEQRFISWSTQLNS